MIVVKQLTKIYQMGQVPVAALNGVSFSIASGEILSIMGASGSGKSTLMNILGCLDRPTDGSYQLDGVEVGNLNDNQLAKLRGQRLGFVFQNFNLLPRVTALANVELPLIYTREKNRGERAMEALERVGLGPRYNHKPSELSGGEQQRVAIARALVNNPSIILADEPTGNLDSQVGNEIMSIFKKLNEQENITVVLVTHDLSIAKQTQRVIVMSDGTVNSDGNVPQIGGFF
jgi:putative ABC transport system ATP-binding protein